MRNKKMLNVLLIMMLVLSMLPTSVFPSVAFAESEMAESTDIVEVANQDGLANMTGDGTYKLTSNITVTNWQAIDFKGTLDGDGYTITLDGTPLFNTLHGSVRNLLLDGNVTSDTATGALAIKMTGGLIQNSWSGASVTVTSF